MGKKGVSLRKWRREEKLKIVKEHKSIKNMLGKTYGTNHSTIANVGVTMMCNR